MSTYIATVTSKGQISLPAELRRKLGITPNSQITLSIEGDSAVLRPVELTLEDIIGSIPALPDELDADYADLAARAWDEAAQDRIRRMNEE